MANRKNQIEQYRGKLSAEKTAEGMNAAARNAKRLYEDACLLFKEGRIPTACAAAILSIEESGKLSLLRAIATAADDAQLKATWRDYRDHRAKNVAWIIAELATKGARTLDDLKPIFDPESDHPAILDAVKQISLYTDCCGNSHWSEPANVIDDVLASKLIEIAKILVPKHEATTREIELWIEHVGKHVGKPSMREGAIEFYKALEHEGLSRHSLIEVKEFFGLKGNEKDNY